MGGAEDDGDAAPADAPLLLLLLLPDCGREIVEGVAFGPLLEPPLRPLPLRLAAVLGAAVGGCTVALLPALALALHRPQLLGQACSADRCASRSRAHRRRASPQSRLCILCLRTSHRPPRAHC
jgi:hypothetical protein